MRIDGGRGPCNYGVRLPQMGSPGADRSGPRVGVRWFDWLVQSSYDERVGSFASGASLGAVDADVESTDKRSLPPRSMVGQLTLDQHIGVRIPGGQPIENKALPSILALP